MTRHRLAALALTAALVLSGCAGLRALIPGLPTADPQTCAMAKTVYDLACGPVVASPGAVLSSAPAPACGFATLVDRRGNFHTVRADATEVEGINPKETRVYPLNRDSFVTPYSMMNVLEVLGAARCQ